MEEQLEAAAAVEWQQGNLPGEQLAGGHGGAGGKEKQLALKRLCGYFIALYCIIMCSPYIAEITQHG